MRFPTVDELIAIHEDLLERTGGHQGILSRGAIESALARAEWGPFYEADDLAFRAALLLRGICQDHPFVDGNKRASFEAADEFLRRNGQQLEARTADVVALMLQVAQAQVDLEEIAQWIRTHLRNPEEQEGAKRWT